MPVEAREIKIQMELVRAQRLNFHSTQEYKNKLLPQKEN
jgi:hypothetical protein